MIRFDGRGILLDVEGTTSSIRYVYDVMFPFVSQNVGRFLLESWHAPETQSALERMAADDGAPSLARWWGELPEECSDQQRQYVLARVAQLMDADAKTTGLKTLQGLVWRSGFQQRQLVAHVYDDVAPALRRWRQAGIDVRVYSSGSVEAQRLFFLHSRAGNLLLHLGGHYDTTIGAKRQRESYVRIAEHWGLAPGQVLFISDAVDELDAALQAGMKTALAVRDASPPEKSNGHLVIQSFEQVQLAELQT